METKTAAKTDTQIHKDILDSISMVWDSSPMPAAAICGYDRIYANDAYLALFDNAPIPLYGEQLSAAEEKPVYFMGRKYTAYITPLKDISLVCFAPSQSLSDELFPVLSAAVRHAVTTVNNAADCISSISDTDEIAQMISSINGTMMTLLSEFIIPEEICVLRTSEPSGASPSSVSDAASSLAQELGTVFAKLPAAVTCNVTAGLFSKADLKAINLILTEFVVSVTGGEYLPDGISVSLARTSSDKAELTAACSMITKRNNPLTSRAVPKPPDYAPAKELELILTEMFGCEFIRKVTSDVSSLTVRIPLCEPIIKNEVRSPLKKFGDISRYSDTNLMFSRLRITDI